MTPLLSAGDLLQLGESCVLRFNHPHQAKKLRREHNVRMYVTIMCGLQLLHTYITLGLVGPLPTFTADAYVITSCRSPSVAPAPTKRIHFRGEKSVLNPALITSLIRSVGVRCACIVFRVFIASPIRSVGVYVCITCA